MFYTKCYNGHIVLIDDKYDGATVECPYCNEDFIVSRMDIDDKPLEGTEEYYTSHGIIHIAVGLIISAGAFAIDYYLYNWLTQPLPSQVPVIPSGPQLLPSAMRVPAPGPSGPSLMPTAATPPAATPAIALTAQPAPAAEPKTEKGIEVAAPPKAPIAAEPAPQPKAPAAAQPPAAQPQPKAPAPVAPRPGPGGDNPY